MSPHKITLEALTVLDAIEQQGSFASAAERLNKVPSALSYIVQKLEEELEVTLFIRQGRRSVLTPAGKHLLQEGRKILNAVEQISTQTQTIANGWEPKLKLAFDSILNFDKIAIYLSQFLQQHPNIELTISEEVMRGTWEVLIEDEVDLVIGAPGPVPQQKGISAFPLFAVNTKLVASPSHPLAQQAKKQGTVIKLADLQSYRTVIVKDSVKSDIPWSKNIIEQSQHFYVQTVSQKMTAIINGIGVGFLPYERIKEYLSNNELVILPFSEEIKNDDKGVELFIAWKTVNRGKGLASLKKILMDSFV